MPPEQVPALELSSTPAAMATSGIQTRLGGVFYLVHAINRLDLPHAFDEAWTNGHRNPWGALSLIGRALLGPQFSRRDSLWRALDTLAGWQDAAPRFRAAPLGPSSDPPWFAPHRWPDELRDPLGDVAWARAGKRACIWSQAGRYLLAHQHAGADAAASAAQLLEKFDRPAGAGTLKHRATPDIPWSPPPVLPTGCAPRYGRWVAAVAPAVQRRLRLAAGEGVPIADLLRASARVYVTASHVDVVFPLATINLRVRRAGLDRNPGWLPDFGRVIYFHFE